jgi:hypothetical protein
MIHYSNFTCWKRLLTVILSAIVLGIVIILVTHHKTTRPADIQLLKKLCHLNTYIEKPPPLIDNSIESNQVTHIYGENNHHKQSMQGDIRLKSNVWDGVPVRGAFYMFVRNQELGKIRETMRSIEDRLNSKTNASYPYIFLNNQRFTPEFKKYVKLASSNPEQVYFGQIDLDAWNFPAWVDSNRADNAMSRMNYLKVEHANSQYFHQKQR